MQYLKTVVGLDISENTFVTRIGSLNTELVQYISNAFSFTNDMKGFKKLLSWIRKMCQNLGIPSNMEINFVMEATGVYYENLAYFLSEENKFVSVILPNKIKKLF